MSDSDVPAVMGVWSGSGESEVAAYVDISSVGLPLCLDEVGDLVNCPAFGDAAQVKVDGECVASQCAWAGVCVCVCALDVYVLHADDEGVCLEEGRSEALVGDGGSDGGVEGTERGLPDLAGFEEDLCQCRVNTEGVLLVVVNKVKGRGGVVGGEVVV